MLAAMMAGGQRRTRYDLIANNHSAPGTAWAVPGGVTSLTVYGSGQGSIVGGGSGAVGDGGGGGGGWITGCVLTVSPGDAIHYTLIGASGSAPDTYQFKRNGSIVFTLESGVFVFGARAGNGGGATWDQGGTTTAFGGAGGSSNGDVGAAGTTATVAGGTIGGGGGGGAGHTFAPPDFGGQGGASGNYFGNLPVSSYGGAGAGVIPGQQRLDGSTVSARPAAYCIVEY